MKELLLIMIEFARLLFGSNNWFVSFSNCKHTLRGQKE